MQDATHLSTDVPTPDTRTAAARVFHAQRGFAMARDDACFYPPWRDTRAYWKTGPVRTR